MWMLLTILRSKAVMMTAGLTIGAIFLHHAAGSYINLTAQNSLLKLSVEQHEQQTKRLNESIEKHSAEVLWARDYTAKQQAKIDRLTKEASAELSECLQLQVPAELF